MASTYSPNLRLELIGTGEQQGTWGTTTNTNLGTLLEEAIGGYASVTVSNLGDTTLTTNNGSADESRNMVINLTGAITAARNVLCPAIEKLYVVKNATTGGYAVTFKVSGQTGVTIPNGETYFLYVNGIDAQKIVGNTASTNTTNTFTANQIISVTDNTNAALRITQLGNGDALLVEDSSNPDSSPFVVKASGYVGIGLTDPSEALEVNGNVLLETSVSGGNSPFLTLKNTSGATPESFGPSIAFDNSVANTHGFVIGQFQGADSYLTISNSESPYNSYMLINQDGNVNIGVEDDPGTILQITGFMTATAYVVGSISGTTLTVTSIGGGTIAIGDRLFGSSTIDYNTYIVSQDSGTTGGTGTYTINNSTTLGSSTIYFVPSSYNTIGFVDTNTVAGVNGPFGGIEWYSSDSTSPGAGVKAYIAALSEDDSPDSTLIFGTADAAQAVERMRINSSGYVGIGKKAPETPLDVAGQIRATEGSVDGRFLPLNSANALIMGAGSNSDVVFMANNIEAMRIAASGKVGVGTTSPAHKFEVVGTTLTPSSQTTYAVGIANSGGGASGDISLGSDSTYGYIQSFWGKPLYINSQGNNIITGSGNVGIGLTSPSNKLHVSGAAQATTFEVGNASDTTISRVSAGVIAVEGDTVAMLDTVNTFTKRQEINASGVGLTINGNNSGAGPTTAQNRLEIIDTDTTTAADQPLGIIRFGTSDAGASAPFPAAIAARAVDANGGAYLDFFTANTGFASASSKMVIRGNGDVEIPSAYNDLLTGSLRDVYVASSGKLGYLSSVRESKTNIKPLGSADWVYSLSPVQFQYRKRNEDKTPSNEAENYIEYGLIAEDVEAVNPDLVFYDETESGKELRGVQYTRIISPLIQIVKDQKAMIDQLNARISVLESKVQ